jgi:hypothetical protein
MAANYRPHWVGQPYTAKVHRQRIDGTFVCSPNFKVKRSTINDYAVTCKSCLAIMRAEEVRWFATASTRIRRQSSACSCPPTTRAASMWPPDA